MKKLSECKLSPSGGIVKNDFLTVWHSMDENKPLKPDYIHYGHTGSTIDEDGIRICGSLEFIESVISRLSDLLKFENNDATRLNIACSELTDKNTGKKMNGKFRCSIQINERGVGGLGILEKMKRKKLAELYA